MATRASDIRAAAEAVEKKRKKKLGANTNQRKANQSIDAGGAGGTAGQGEALGGDPNRIPAGRTGLGQRSQTVGGLVSNIGSSVDSTIRAAGGPIRRALGGTAPSTASQASEAPERAPVPVPSATPPPEAPTRLGETFVNRSQRPTAIPSVFNEPGQNLAAFQDPQTGQARVDATESTLQSTRNQVFRDPNTIQLGDAPGDVDLVGTSQRLGGGRTQFNLPEGTVTTSSSEGAQRIANGRGIRGGRVGSFNTENLIASNRLDNAIAAVQRLGAQGASGAVQAEAFDRISRGSGSGPDLSLEARAREVQADIDSGRVNRREGQAALARLGRALTERDLTEDAAQRANRAAARDVTEFNQQQAVREANAITSREGLAFRQRQFQQGTAQEKQQLQTSTAKAIQTIFRSDTPDSSTPAAAQRALSLEQTTGGNGFLTLSSHKNTAGLMQQLQQLQESATTENFTERQGVLASLLGASRAAGLPFTQDDLISILNTQ